MANERARYLRKNMTDAERVLWMHLRDRRLDEYKFRRQHPIGHYIVDFVCLIEKLIIEVDGGQHAIESDGDERRTNYLNEKGYRVIRFWNNEVLLETDAVLDEILFQLKTKDPSPRSSPQRGEGADQKRTC